MTIDYSKGKIYKLVNNSSTDCYYGSTCIELHKRKYQHKANYIGFLNGKSHFVTSYTIIEPNIHDVDIVLVESFPCLNKQALHARERYFIENFKCVNKNVPGRTDKESGKVYRQTNRDVILEKKKQSYQDNKDYILAKIKCDCGISFGRYGKNRHLKSEFHKNYESSKDEK